VLRGCHAWSLNGRPLVVKQAVKLARGGSLTLTNNDLMAQELVKKSGSAVKWSLLGPAAKSQVMKGESMGMAGRYTLSHMGARLKVTFAKAGTYRFALMDRGDYAEVKTIGDDHELTLKVVVS
jgi:cellulose synthase/poly-beta-1,6-N-acetylglucosamine synthase-like glycosyltransferase